MKKLLLITFLLFTTLSFSQQNDKNNNAIQKNKTTVTITSITASPNPFTTKTNIRFQSSKTQLVQFSIKNLLGKKVYSQPVHAKTGLNKIVFEKNELIKGMYIYTIQSETEIASKRLVIK